MPPTPLIFTSAFTHAGSVCCTLLALGQHLDGPLPSPPGSQEAFMDFFPSYMYRHSGGGVGA